MQLLKFIVKAATVLSGSQEKQEMWLNYMSPLKRKQQFLREAKLSLVLFQILEKKKEKSIIQSISR